MELWTGGGLGVNGSTAGTGVWNIGVRYGWVLTDQHGPGLVRGRLEYAADLVPVFLVFQPAGTAYGFGLDPIALKWNFEEQHHISPYFEAFGGTLFTNHPVPSETSHINFTTGGGVGMTFFRSKHYWGADVRFMHISNAGLTTLNPGINTLQVRLGFGLFTKKR